MFRFCRLQVFRAQQFGYRIVWWRSIPARVARLVTSPVTLMAWTEPSRENLKPIADCWRLGIVD